MRDRVRRVLAWGALATAAGLATAPAAGAACTLTLVLVPCIQATWPSASVGFGSVDAGTTTTSPEQVMEISANTSWGIRVSADQPGGRPREFDGTTYVASSPKVLTHSLQWGRTSVDGTPQTPTWTDLATSASSVVAGRDATGCALGLLCGTDTVGLKLRLRSSFADRRAAPNSYRLLVTYDAQTGF